MYLHSSHIHTPIQFSLNTFRSVLPTYTTYNNRIYSKEITGKHLCTDIYTKLPTPSVSPEKAATRSRRRRSSRCACRSRRCCASSACRCCGHAATRPKTSMPAGDSPATKEKACVWTEDTPLRLAIPPANPRPTFTKHHQSHDYRG